MFLILFFKYCVVLTWKIVVSAKASVLYIYIYICYLIYNRKKKKLTHNHKILK